MIGGQTGVYLLGRALLILHLLSASPYAASKDEDAVRWLQRSGETAGAVAPSGVYEESQRVHLHLLQARAWALLGDVERTLELLPAADGDKAEWTSGGDGMVRLLIFNLETGEVLRLLLGTLINRGHLAQGLELVQSMYQRRGLDLYLDLGLSLHDAPSKLNLKPLEPAHIASIQMGWTGALLARDLLEEAGATFHAIDESLRPAVFEKLSRRYLLDGNLDDLIRLAQMDAGHNSAKILAEAIIRAGRSIGSDQVPDLVDLIKAQSFDSTQLAMIALRYLEQNQIDAGRRLLFEASGNGSETWEQVAIRTQEHGWLRNYYRSIKDPWRRSERYYQYALRLLQTDARQDADKIAALSLESVQQIPSANTRALALRLLTEYHSRAGNPESVAELVRQIENLDPPQSRELALARVQLAISQVGISDVAAVREILASVDLPRIRVTGRVLTAAAARGGNPSAYDGFVAAAREDIRSLEIVSEQQSAWSELISMQTEAGDLAGARQSADLAADTGHSAAALEVIADYQISREDFDDARDTIGSIPGGADIRSGADRRQLALGRLLTKLVEKGRALEAMETLAQMDPGPVRELNTTQVLQALLDEGRYDAAESLLSGLHRPDMIEHALAILLYDMAVRGELPDPVRHLARIPRRRGAALCWAASAAVMIENPARINAWVDNLPDANCRAFALAGAAYGVLLPDQPGRVNAVFELVDPVRVEKRMERAMLETLATQE